MNMPLSSLLRGPTVGQALRLPSAPSLATGAVALQVTAEHALSCPPWASPWARSACPVFRGGRDGSPSRPSTGGIFGGSPCGRPKAGFTVLELLVATALLSVIVTLLFSIFDRASNAWIKSEATVDRQRSARTTLELISRDMSQAFITTTATGRVIFAGGSNWVYFAAPVAPGGDMVSDLGEYAYVHDPAPTANTITRYYSAPTPTNSISFKWNPNGRFDSVVPASSAATNLAASSLLAEGAVGFRFQYYDAAGNESPSGAWNTSASGPLAQQNTLPALVEVTMLAVDSRTASHLPAVNPARANAINQYGRTNSAVIRLQNAQ